ncbi:MAG: hypothetical protein AB7F32_06485 [Victivallaceae bacterium]
MATKKNTKIKILWLSSAVILLILILIPLSMLFSRRPNYPVPPLEPADWSFQTKLLLREMPRIMKSKPGETATMTLSPEEVNSVLRFAANRGNLAGLFNPGAKPGGALDGSLQKMRYADGEFEIFYAYDTGYPILFGGHIILMVNGKAEVKPGGEVILQPSRVKVGAFPVDNETAVKYARDGLRKAEKSSGWEDFKSIVESMRIDDQGNLVIVYRPHELARRIFKNLQPK